MREKEGRGNEAVALSPSPVHPASGRTPFRSVPTVPTLLFQATMRHTVTGHRISVCCLERLQRSQSISASYDSAV